MEVVAQRPPVAGAGERRSPPRSLGARLVITTIVGLTPGRSGVLGAGVPGAFALTVVAAVCAVCAVYAVYAVYADIEAAEAV